MKIGYILQILLVIAITNLQGQNAIPPDYLTKQDFPDSVLNLQLLKLNGGNVDVSTLLKTYEGKKVVIDFWASWCKDCIIGLPKLNKLMTRTKADDVVYVFISVDKEEAKWKSAIDRFSIKGEHYRVEVGWYNTLTNYIQLDWIPRYVVLNEQGRILMPKAILADSEELKQSVIK
jgi:thiol-disulfide isomerase/thioredoxin